MSQAPLTDLETLRPKLKSINDPETFHSLSLKHQRSVGVESPCGHLVAVFEIYWRYFMCIERRSTADPFADEMLLGLMGYVYTVVLKSAAYSNNQGKAFLSPSLLLSLSLAFSRFLSFARSLSLFVSFSRFLSLSFENQC